MTRASMSPVRRFEASVGKAMAGPCGGPLPGPLLVAVSGGPDSLALLHALARSALRCALHVAYFDHGLRPAAEVAEEREFVSAQADALGVPFTCGSGDVRAVARREHRSIEEAARRCRYQFLGSLARATGAEAIATGHTASDQAETVLLRMVRGTGIAGLAAMDWRSLWPLGGHGPVVVRPLLGLWRRDTEAYCAALGLLPRRDAENESLRYARNRVRHEVLPLLRSLNPRVDEALVHLADSARAAQAAVSREADAVWPKAARVEPDAVTLLVDVLWREPEAVRAGLVRRALACLCGGGVPPVRERVQAVIHLARPGGHAGTVELPGGLVVTRSAGELCVQRRARPVAALRGTWPLAVPGETLVPGWRIVVEPAGIAAPGTDSLSAWLRPEVFNDAVHVSGRQAGDRIEPAGIGGHSRKVQDLLVDARVPRLGRDAVPILRTERGIAWVVGVRIAGWAAAHAGEQAMRVSFHKDEPRELNRVYERPVDELEQPC